MRTRTVVLLAVVVTVASLLLAGLAAGGGAGGGPAAADVGPETRPSRMLVREPGALAVLHRWDRRRARAWATGDPTALALLYAPGSACGRRDVRALRRWTRRGLRVTGLRQQMAGLRVARRGERRLVVVVTERTVGGVAVGATRRTQLPSSVWATHRISLVRVGRRWRVDEVWGQPAR